MSSNPLAPVTDALLTALEAVVGTANLKRGAAVAAMDTGWHPHNLGAGIVIAPGSTAEVAEVVRLCAAQRVPLVPQGGRTGLVGGSISAPGEIVLSSARLQRIVRLDATERVAVVEAGCTLEALQQAAAALQLEPGIDLAARGSATIGGMVATNAGGVMAFRNGVMRHRVLGLEAVLPDGSVMSDLTRVVKNSAGYDLKQLFIGAEGTLGFVTRIAVKLDPLPAASATALFGLPSVAAALELVRRALDPAAGHLRAAEALWQRYIRLTAKALHWQDAGMPLEQPIYLLLGLGGSDEAALRNAFETLYEQALQAHPQTTGLVAASARQERALWRLREDTDILYRAHPAAPSYDVSVPLSAIERYAAGVQSGLAALDATLQPYLFGHLADGNLHIVLNREGPLPDALSAAVEQVLYRELPALGGSFSAEHGVGSKRIGSMFDTVDATKLALMARVKQLFDPAREMNPGKVLPD